MIRKPTAENSVSEPAADKAVWESQQLTKQHGRANSQENSAREQHKWQQQKHQQQKQKTKAKLEHKRQIVENSRRLSGRQNLPFLCSRGRPHPRHPQDPKT
jgi:hypothetical protein